MKVDIDVFAVLSFHSFRLVRFPVCLCSIYFCSVSLTLSHCVSLLLLRTYLRWWLLFFNSPWLSFYPLALPFFLFSLSLYLSFALSPALLLSPSERLRIPKGADAIKMLILSVYRERERGGWQHEGLRLTWRTRLKWRTEGGEHWGSRVGVRWKRRGEGICVEGRQSEKGDASEGKGRQG